MDKRNFCVRNLDLSEAELKALLIPTRSRTTSICCAVSSAEISKIKEETKHQSIVYVDLTVRNKDASDIINAIVSELSEGEYSNLSFVVKIDGHMPKRLKKINFGLLEYRDKGQQ